MAFNGVAAKLTYEADNVTVNGSAGDMQDELFYMTERLNLTVITKPCTFQSRLLENGSWSGGMGVLQRQEADIASYLLGVDLQRTQYVDFPIPTRLQTITLIATKPRGVPSLWLFIRVYGILEWALYFSLLIVFIAFYTMSRLMIKRSKETPLGEDNESTVNIVLAGLAISFLFALQNGEHKDSATKSLRILTLTLSFLTCLMFIYYTGDLP